MAGATNGFNDLAGNPGTAALSYVRALATLYAFAPRIPDPAKAPRDDPSWWRKALRDPVVRKAIQKRVYAVAGREWRVMSASDTSPADKVVASVTEEALDCIGHFDRSRALLAAAIFRGSSYGYIEGERRFVSLGVDPNGSPLPPRWWWVPTEIIDVDPYRFELRRTPAGDYVWHFASVTDGDGTAPAFDTWAPLEHPEWFVRHVYEPTESSLRYGQGLQDALEFSLWAKQELWRNFLCAARRAGRGFFEVETDDIRNGSTSQENEERIQDWKNALEAVREDGDLIHALGDKVKLLDTPIEGLQIIRQQILDLNDDMTSLILFGTMPTGGGAGGNGSYARAETEADSGREAFHFDQASLSESITAGPVDLFYRLNRENFEAIGAGKGRRGRFEIVNEAKPDAKAAAEVVKLLLEAGATLRLDEVLERCGGWTPPKKGEDVLKPAADPNAANVGDGPDDGAGDGQGEQDKDAPAAAGDAGGAS